MDTFFGGASRQTIFLEDGPMIFVDADQKSRQMGASRAAAPVVAARAVHPLDPAPICVKLSVHPKVFAHAGTNLGLNQLTKMLKLSHPTGMKNRQPTVE
jgi:hypothetical protein